MGNTCASVASWLWNLNINWDGWSAVGTIAATVVALFLPQRMAAREWARQDALRQSDVAAIKEQDAAAHREIASAVDRILAYHESAVAILNSEPVYNVGINAIKRIGLNTQILSDLIDLLMKRPGLSDGVLYSALAARRIAFDIIGTSGDLVKDWGVLPPNWPLRKLTLTRHKQLVDMARLRSAKVREHYGLEPSTSAADIRAKYLPLAQKIIAAMSADSGEPAADLDESYT